MTKRQKFIASCSIPHYTRSFDKEEVKRVKALAKGKFWHDQENAQFCAFSPGGRRRFFEYRITNVTEAHLQRNVFDFLNNQEKQRAKRAAELWSAGLCKEASKLESMGSII